MAVAPKKVTLDEPVTPEVAKPEPVKVEVVETKTAEPKLSAKTLAEQEAGRAALAAHAKRV